jgi:hypothetical protein
MLKGNITDFTLEPKLFNSGAGGLDRLQPKEFMIGEPTGIADVPRITKVKDGLIFEAKRRYAVSLPCRTVRAPCGIDPSMSSASA